MGGQPSAVPEAPVPVAGARSVAAPRRGHSQRGGWGFLLPAVIVLFALTIFPFIFTVVLSLSNVDLTAGLQDRDLKIAAGGDGARRILAAQRIESRANHVVGVG